LLRSAERSSQRDPLRVVEREDAGLDLE